MPQLLWFGPAVARRSRRRFPGRIDPGTHGLNGQDLELMSGISAKGYASEHVELLVPTSPGAVVVVDPNTSKPVLLINYHNLTSDQLNGMRGG